METGAGGVYRVVLGLVNAESIGPSWLVGAFTSTYPEATVLSVDRYTDDEATVLVKWHRGTGSINEGEPVTVGTEAMQQIPGGAIPRGVVTSIEVVEPPGKQAQVPNPVKLALAGAMLLTVTYFSNKIADNHGQSRPS